MLTFGRTNIIFGIALALSIVLYFFYSFPFWIFGLLLFLYSLILFYGCYYIRSGFFMPVICSLPGKNKQIVLSFDDGPHPQTTGRILDILEKHKAKAVFFCIGKKVKENPYLFKEMVNRGHLVGNHSFSHDAYFDFWSWKRMMADLKQMNDVSENTVGSKLRLFRPPYGVMNPNLKKAILRGGFVPVGWSMRSFDTRANDKDKFLKKLNRSIAPGRIFLFHDSMEITGVVLDDFLKEVKNRGYAVVALDKALPLQPYA